MLPYELPLIRPFTMLGADFVDIRSMSEEERITADIAWQPLYLDWIAHSNSDPTKTSLCSVADCSITDQHLIDFGLAREQNATLTLNEWQRAGNGLVKYGRNLGLPEFFLVGFVGNEVVAAIPGMNVVVEKQERNVATISVKLFTVWAPRDNLNSVQLDGKCQRWLLENILRTEPGQPNLDIVEIQHYRDGPGTGYELSRYPAYDTEFFAELLPSSDPVLREGDTEPKAFRLKTADPILVR